MSFSRTIETILNLTTGEQIEVADLFKNQHRREAEIFQLRTLIEKNLQDNEVEHVCLYCKQPVVIRGRSGDFQGKHFYFNHPYKSAECVIKTQSRLSEDQVRCIKYNGEKESLLHKSLKQSVGHYLKKDCNIISVKIDQIYKDRAISKKWRKPDVLVYHNRIGKIAFELQLSTTFLSVIVGRSLFYQRRGIYLIWVFPSFSLEDDLQKFTQKDVFYNNNSNVYVFDEKAQEASEDRGSLMLTCYYKNYALQNEEVVGYWDSALIGLADMFFIEDYRCYYFDSEGRKAGFDREIEKGRENKHALARKEHRRVSLERIVNYLKRYYKKDWLPQGDEDHLTELINGLQPEYINELLKFHSDNAYVIKNLFFKRNKLNFLRFVCSVENIWIDTSILIENGRTVFEDLLEIEDNHQFNQYAACLFRKGYQLNLSDENAMELLYDKYYFNASEIEKDKIERWATATIYASLANRNIVFDIVKMNRVLMAIASLKHQMVIGFAYTHMKQIAHYIFDKHSEYALTYMHAIKVYGQYDKLLKDDKSDKLKERFNQLQKSSEITFPRYDYVIYQVFPELK